MNKIFLKITTALMLGVLCFSILPAAAYAEQQSVEISIPVSVSIQGDFVNEADKNSEVFEIVLSPDKESYPLPDGSDSNVFVLKIRGENSSSFDIKYSGVGVYTYTIYQKSGNNSIYTYDNTKYKLNVYVTNDEQNQPKISATLHNDRDTGKPDSVYFVNIAKNRAVLPRNNDLDSDSDSDTDTETESSDTSDIDSDTSSDTDKKENPVTPTVISTVSPSVSTAPEQPATVSSVSRNPFKTGDTRHVALYTVVMMLAVLAIAISVINKEKN